MTLSEQTLTTYSLFDMDGTKPSEARVNTVLRDAAKRRDTAPFEAVHLTFSEPMAAFAYLEAQSLFQGWSRANWMIGEALERHEEQGIYRTHNDLFHPDSEDFEHDVMENEARASALASKMMDANCNFAQATAVMPMTRMVVGVFRGSVIDIMRFTRAVGRRSQTDFHPHTRELAETMMAELMANYRPLVDALIEGEAV